MIEGSYEETEILLQHSEFVLGQLENAARQFSDTGDIMKQLNSPEGVKLRNFAAAYVEAKQKGGDLPTISPNLSQMREKIAMQMIMPIRTIDYTVYWCKLSADQLKSITQASRDFDLRWNLPMTLSACRLFSAFCRIVLYLHKITPATFLIHLFSSSSLMSSLPLQCDFNELLSFVTRSQEQPFAFISQELEFMKCKLSLMVVSMLPFFSTLFADWTVFDWSLLSIYERTPESTLGDSMPLNEYTLLANVSFFHEILVLFTLTFSSFMDESQQFFMLGSAVLSETSVFYLSRNFPVPIQELLKCTPKSPTIANLMQTLERATRRKENETHHHRVKQLALLAGEIVNYAGLDIHGFMRHIHIVRAIAGFSFYEIDLFFRNKNGWSDEQVKSVGQLLAFCVKLAMIFIKEKTQIERFFLFNLATVDADHLAYLLSMFGQDLGAAGGDVVATGQLILESLEDLSLEKFDNGIRYDFYPLQLTHGRALVRHNIISQKLLASFLTPLCEHLMTISLHASAASDATRFFLDSCPLHTLWRHARLFDKYINHPAAPTGDCAAFFYLFQLFNYDSIILQMHEAESSQVITICENQVRPHLSSKILTILSQVLGPKSRLFVSCVGSEIGKSAPIDNLEVNLLDNKYCMKEAKEILTVANANNLIEGLPKKINVLGSEIVVAPYIIKRISGDLFKIYLFNMPNNIASIENAAQIVWTFLSQCRALNIDIFDDIDLTFRQALLEAISNNVFFGSSKFTDQASILLGTAPEDLVNKVGQQTFVGKIMGTITNFIKGGHINHPYCHFTDSFLNSQNQSVQYYRELLRTLGIHGALFMDSSLIEFITKQYVRLVKIFDSYGGNFDAAIANPKSKQMESAKKSLHKIAIAVVIRNMIRRAIRLVIEEVFPGIVEVINSDKKQLPDTPECHIFLELVGYHDDMYFIKERLAKKVNKGIMDIVNFYKFFAVVYSSFDYTKVAYDSENDTLSNNLHLLPISFVVLIKLSSNMFKGSSKMVISQSVKEFFSNLSEIMYHKNKSKALPPSFCIMVDKFFTKKYGIDYGLIKHAYTHSSLALSYPKPKVE